MADFTESTYKTTMPSMAAFEQFLNKNHHISFAAGTLVYIADVDTILRKLPEFSSTKVAAPLYVSQRHLAAFLELFAVTSTRTGKLKHLGRVDPKMLLNVLIVVESTQEEQDQLQVGQLTLEDMPYINRSIATSKTAKQFVQNLVDYLKQSSRLTICTAEQLLAYSMVQEASQVERHLASFLQDYAQNKKRSDPYISLPGWSIATHTHINH